MGQLWLTTRPAIAQISQATITEIVDGDEVFIEPAGVEIPDTSELIPAEVDAVAAFQDTIRTEDARAALLFDNGAAGRLGPDSQVMVGQCIEVQAGLLLAAGPANGCTATFAVGVQGTIYTIGVDETGNQIVQVLEGEVMVALNENLDSSESESEPASQPDASDSPSPAQPTLLKPKQSTPNPEVLAEPAEPGDREANHEADPPTETESLVQTLQAGEKVAITPEGEFGEKSFMSADDILLILGGVLFDDFEQSLPGMANLQATLEELYPDLDLPRLPGFDLPLPVRPSIPSPF
ncbi:MAG: hypothetical protein ACPGVO_08435 [Spirulinaceae cyanobacterium]